MVKVSIIDVDLGCSVDQIINDAVMELSTETKKTIEEAVEQANAVQRLKDEKQQEKARADSQADQAIEAALKLLRDAGDNGVLITDLMAAVYPGITTPSALTMRLKARLRQAGNDYILDRTGRLDKARYSLKPFNVQPEVSPSSDQEP